MKPTSIFLATYLVGQTNYDGTDWVYPEIVPYTPDFMKQLVEEAGLVFKPLDWPHVEVQTWFAVINPEFDL